MGFERTHTPNAQARRQASSTSRAHAASAYGRSSVSIHSIEAAIAADRRATRRRNLVALLALQVVACTALVLMVPAISATQAALDGDQEALQVEALLDEEEYLEAQEALEGSQEGAQADSVDADDELDAATGDDAGDDLLDTDSPKAQRGTPEAADGGAQEQGVEPSDSGEPETDPGESGANQAPAAQAAAAETAADAAPDAGEAPAAAAGQTTDAEDPPDSPDATPAKEAASRTATLSYEDDALSAKARVVDAEPIPADAQLVVTPITPDMPDFAAYMTALNRGYDSQTYNSGNSLLYDVSVVVDGREYEPVDGKVDITMKFKEGQLSEELGLDGDESSFRVIHLPVKGGSDGRDISDIGSESLKPAQIERESVEDASLKLGKSETVSFSLDGLSVITVTGASTDVTVNASLMGTDMKSLGYNLYAYLLANNDGKARGAKISFANGVATATIPNVPPNTYRLYLVYAKDNRELQTDWNYNNVLDSNNNIWVDTDGGYVFGYSAKMPADKTVSATDNTVSFALEVTDLQSTVDAASIMDRAMNYGITAEQVEYNVRAYANFATKQINIRNSNDSATYNHRADGIDVVPNIIADVNNNGQKLSTGDKPANYYFTEADQDKVNSTNTTDTIIRNKNEIEDRVEIMISNTLKQAEALATQSMLTLPSTTSVDVSPYADDATIILDATAISGEQNGFTIVKRPGQTIVFNINGQNVAPPQNIKVKLVDKNGNQIGDIRKAGDDMRNAPASDGDVWNKIIWNFPDATSVTATNCIGGIFLVPKGDFTVANKGGGWIVARGKVSVTNEWYGFPGNDEPFKQKIIRKTFVGIGADEVDPAYALKVWTHTNESTSGTTHEQLITSLVLKPTGDTSLVKDSSGANDQTGYLSTGTDEDGNVFYEWKTPPLSVGNEHMLTEEHSTSTTGQAVELIDFLGPYSAWSESAKDYVWTNREATFTSEAEMAGVFNVSAHNDDYRQYVYVTNQYHVQRDPHDLSLTKDVMDPEGLAASGQDYSFTVSLKDEAGAALPNQQLAYTVNGGVQQHVALSGGKATVKLRRDDTLVFVGLPYGTQYEVVETDLPAKCTVAFGGDTSRDDMGTGKLIKDRAVVATNTFSDDPGFPITAHKDLVDGVLSAGQFTFRLVDGAGHVVKEAVNDANGNVSFGTLVFDADGVYDYHLYEVADPDAADIVFDSVEYDVHLTVEGGRVRSVEYENEETGATATVPMFRNKKVPTDSDTLTARKVFIDEDTGKAIDLDGGEFTFTATSKAADGEEPIVYTGVNDGDGMVTFYDANGAVVDLDALDQPTTFTISEVDGSYTGQLEEGKTLAYDDSAHDATATVDIKTVSANPVTVTASGNDNAMIDVTFIPRKAGSQYYFTQPGGGLGIVYPRSDGSVTFTIQISKNQTGTDGSYRDINVEYGIGDKNSDWINNTYSPHEMLGSIAINAKGGSWNTVPIEVRSVRIDGQTLSSTTSTEKTVKLVYAEGSYPVFTNTVSSPQPDTAEFTFTKVWVDNVTYSSPREWEVGKELTLRLAGSFHPEDASAQGSTSVYTFKVKRLEDADGQVAFGFTQPGGDGAPQIELASTSGGNNHYRFIITGLPDTDTVGGSAGRWSYLLTEEPLDGYAVGYGAWNADERKAESDQVIASRGIESGGYVINAQVSVELPSTGGLGTGMLAFAGVLLVALAGALLVARRRLHAR